ncbi:MAG: dihydrolipoyl dehydrogenase [Propionibacteriales bacterium]|nr:dihydrolipoyl dehydrogenase [Propionibacteriales bacterium]
MPSNTTAEPYDLVILGAGSGGYAAALRAAQLGMRVAMVERDLVGGTCLHRGCIPTKAILHAAEVADAARDGAQFGIHATVDRIDAAEVRAYSEQVVGRLHKGLNGLVNSRGIEVITGTGRLVPDGDGVGVEVDGQLINGEHIVLATGSYARTVPDVEIDGVRVITSEHALKLDALPASAIVLGGGVIGVEFASAWRSLGVEVTIVEALDRLVPAEDPEISKVLSRAFRKRDIAAKLGSPVDRVTTTPDGVTVSVGGKDLTADVLLVAVGRGPSTDDAGFAEAGVTLERGFVPTDERLRTNLDQVYAVGDIVPGLQLAHRGFAHGIFVAEDIAYGRGLIDRAPLPLRDVTIPRVTYCEPEIASVGLTETQARTEYGDAVETLTYDLGGNGKSQILRTQGFVKLVRQADGPVLGVHMIGARVGELVGEAQLITGWDAHPEDVAGLVHAHPTQNEALGEAHLALAGKPLHVHG